MIIHDLKLLDCMQTQSEDVVINECLNHCKGCFNCWIKHPMQCVFNDELKNIGATLLECDTLVIISRCIYGCYSSPVKKIMERSIGYVEPFFTLREKEIHHKTRNNKKINMIVYFYGDISEYSKQLATDLVYRNAKNLNTNVPEIHFVQSLKQLGESI